MASLHIPTFIAAGSRAAAGPPGLSPLNKPLRLQSNRRQSFLDLTPESRHEDLSIDLSPHDPSLSPLYDAAIIGCGPSGLRLAERASALGLRICLVDPSPLSSWPNNYGAWLDEIEPLGLSSCFDAVWPTATVHLRNHSSPKHLPRPYGRVSRRALKTLLLQNCAAAGVRFHRAKAWEIHHEEFKSTIACSDGTPIRASLVVDAAGFSTPFPQFDKSRNSQGFQIAHGILAEVESHPFDLDKMLLMDWRDEHLGNEPDLRSRNAAVPTFLYAMPFTDNLVFLEETSLVGRPAVGYGEVKRRMVARLRHLGIRVRRVLEEEKCLIPMGGPIPEAEGVLRFGGAAGLVHPATGYMVARAMGTAGEVAEEMAECLGGKRMVRGRAMRGRVWGRMWTRERRAEREFYCFGMETLLKLDLEGTRGFFEAFFGLDARYWEGFLSSRLSVRELAELSLLVFARACNRSKVDTVTKCPLPLARMVRNLALQAL